ncbi:hypothetical protein Leryth_013283 [Lithospermum erythrorhizon]|nr:hypothetical protein Leryth_013283 [Lithospermum erythrorhizon]
MAAKSAAPPPPGDEKRRKKAERSAYFSRREAAKILRTVLQGDARRRAIGSIKSLVYSPQVRNKKATYALVCQTQNICQFSRMLWKPLTFQMASGRSK